MSAHARLPSRPVLMSLVLAAAIVLSSVPLSLLISGGDWLLLPLAAAVVVGGLGALVRWFVPRPMRALPVQVIGLILLVLAVEILTGVLPSGGPVGAILGQPGVIRDGVQVLFAGRAPMVLAPSSRIVILVLIGLVVLALDVLCVEGRWYAVTALLLLGFMLVPALMAPDGGGWASAAGPILGALAVLALGSLPGGDDLRPRSRRRRRRGRRRLTVEPAGPVSSSAVDSAAADRAGQPAVEQGEEAAAGRGWTLDRPGRRLALGLLGAGVVAAATPAVSALLPRASKPAFPIDIDRINAWQGRTSLLNGAMIDDSVSVRRNLLQGRETEMLRFRTDDPTPGYLRLQALTQFDGESFLPAPTRGASAETRTAAFSDRELASSKPSGSKTYEITISALVGDHLPTPFPIRWSDAGDRVDLSGVGRSNGELVVDGGVQDLGGLEYSVAVDTKTFSPSALRAVSREQMQVPYSNGYVSVGSTPAIHALATEIARQAPSDSAYDIATVLAEYFHQNFEYSLTVTSAPGENPIDAFLADRVGYCEQFAATFALVMNDLKFATRVSIGFTSGSPDSEERSVTNHNAHAWPETWFGPEHGWVRFEPTPAAADNGVATPTFASDTPKPDESADQNATPSDEATTEESSSASAPSEDATSSAEETTSSTSSEAAASDAGGSGPPWWGWALGGAGLSALALGGGAVGRTAVRRRALAARERRWQALDASRAAELAWGDVVRAVEYRAWALRLLGWTRLYGKHPVVLHLDPALPPGAALETLLDDAEAGGLEVPDTAREAADRIAGAITTARYAPRSEATAPSVLREDSDEVRAVVLGRRV